MAMDGGPHGGGAVASPSVSAARTGGARAAAAGRPARPPADLAEPSGAAALADADRSLLDPARVRPGTVAVWGLAATALALGILLCALALVALAGATSLAGGPWRPLGDQVNGAVERTGQAAAVSGQAVRDAFDPSHPPRDALPQDAEFDALQLVGVGEALAAADQSRVELARIAKRPDAQNPTVAQYALVRRAWITPQTRRVLGVPLGEDRGEQEHYLYQGQSFRLGSHYYKVNWVSVDRQQIAIARYRTADGVIGSLVFEYD
jgi:hypothetical protein